MKIVKTFKFEVSNWTKAATEDDKSKYRYDKDKSKLYTPQMIDDVIDDFIFNCGYEVVDIKVNTVDVHYHNNARGNQIELWYTLICETEEEE